MNVPVLNFSTQMYIRLNFHLTHSINRHINLEIFPMRSHKVGLFSNVKCRFAVKGTRREKTCLCFVLKGANRQSESFQDEPGLTKFMSTGVKARVERSLQTSF